MYRSKKPLTSSTRNSTTTINSGPNSSTGTPTESEPSNSSLLESKSRKRQSKRDDAIRRKIENDLSKKRYNKNHTLFKHKKGLPGTALSLRPSEPITCSANATVFEVSHLMTAKRENCILVVNDNGELIGIFTAKDLAFRVVGVNLNANTITIDKIMTPNPLCTNANDLASDALNLMLEKGFRHLPVLDDDTNKLVGVLDITKCYAQQMQKLERMHDSSKKLYEALDLVNTEMGMIQPQPLQIYQYVETLKNKMNSPTLESVLDSTTVPIYCSMKTSVYDATVLMKNHKTTAVLIRDNDNKVNGIFTSKDVVLRVIAAGLDPKTCSIVRVMTPQPDVGVYDLSIQEALRKMFDGHYLNLPVINDNGDIIGIVEVLKLTYAILNQIKLMNSLEEMNDPSIMSDNDRDNGNSHNNEGPAWRKFWTSLDNDSDSVHSGSLTTKSNDIPSTPDDRPVTPNIVPINDLNPDIKPSDSISAFDTPQKLVDNIETVPPFIFKFRSAAIENRVHRISINPSDGLVKLRQLIDDKLHTKDFELLNVTKTDDEGDNYAISYIDDEGDIVSITSDSDLIDCINVYTQLNTDKADIYLHNPHQPAPIEGIKVRKHHHRHNPRNNHPRDDLIPGVANEILIPGVIMVLATSLVIGFTMSRK